MNFEIVLNGSPHSVEMGSSVLDIIHSRSIEPAHVVIELNRAIIEREKFDSTLLKNGDVIEMLRFVGGG